MYSRIFQLSLLFILAIVATCLGVTTAKTPSNDYFGDTNQSGYRLHIKIMELVDSGLITKQAINDALDSSLSNKDKTLSSEAKLAVAADITLAKQFYNEMLKVNSLTHVSKTLLEFNPNKAVRVTTLGLMLYPKFAQDVFDGVAIVGILSPKEILAVALHAGAEPNSISIIPTAVLTTLVPLTATPLGVGIGSGGTGSGDITASTN